MMFGERLRELRRKKYSQEELADLLQVHNNTISRWENGTQEPRMTTVKKIADIFGTTAAYLVGETDNISSDDISKVKDNLNVHERKSKIPNMAYWGGVVDNVRCVLNNGNKEDISDVYVILKRAISLITEKSTEGAYNGNNSSYNAAVMSVNAAIGNVKQGT